MNFNKKIKTPGIQLRSLQENGLQEPKGIAFPISTVIEVEVTNADVDLDEGFNKRIADMTFIGSTENSLEVKINF